MKKNINTKKMWKFRFFKQYNFIYQLYSLLLLASSFSIKTIIFSTMYKNIYKYILWNNIIIIIMNDKFVIQTIKKYLGKKISENIPRENLYKLIFFIRTKKFLENDYFTYLLTIETQNNKHFYLNRTANEWILQNEKLVISFFWCQTCWL